MSFFDEIPEPDLDDTAPIRAAAGHAVELWRDDRPIGADGEW
jgi:hypothetical protein